MVDLRLHGDADVLRDGADLSVNVVTSTPAFMRDALAAALPHVGEYPDATAATQELAAHLGLDPASVLLTAGGAEGFTLVARARPRRAPAVVHPQFTEPEAALLAAGHHVTRVLLDEATDFALDPGAVRTDADLVVVGNPTNPTSRLHAADAVRALTRPGRTVVVDEAFMDATDESQSLLPEASRTPGLLVLRSLTKTYGIPGIRAGFVVGRPETLAHLRAVQTPWSVGTLALAAVRAVTTDAAAAHAAAWRGAIGPARDELTALLRARAFRVIAPAQAPFVLAHRPGAADLRAALRADGIALRRGDTFPGLGPDWVRIAVRDAATHARLAAAIDRHTDLKEH